jgi:hypothetical protein
MFKRMRLISSKYGMLDVANGPILAEKSLKNPFFG